MDTRKFKGCDPSNHVRESTASTERPSTESSIIRPLDDLNPADFKEAVAELTPEQLRAGRASVSQVFAGLIELWAEARRDGDGQLIAQVKRWLREVTILQLALLERANGEAQPLSARAATLRALVKERAAECANVQTQMRPGLTYCRACGALISDRGEVVGRHLFDCTRPAILNEFDQRSEFDADDHARPPRKLGGVA
jgi:hypothetical protein